MSLDQQSCEPCRGGIPPLSAQEAEAALTETPGWKLIDDAGKLQRNIAFDDFKSAWAYADQVAQLSEDHGHHPDITFGWGYCSVIFYSHKIGGLHRNDFIMAAKCNALLDA